MKQERNRARWLSVLRQKEANMEEKQKNLRKMLAKGFKREKQTKTTLDEEKYQKDMVNQLNHERHEKAKEKKRIDDLKFAKDKRDEEVKYRKKMEMSEQRRMAALAERRNERTATNFYQTHDGNQEQDKLALGGVSNEKG